MLKRQQGSEANVETKGLFGLALVLGLVFALASAAAAQLIIPEQTGLEYSFFAGAAVSVNDTLNSESSPTVGISWYGPNDTRLGTGSAIGLSADWIGIKRNDGVTVNLVPVFFNYKQYGIAMGYRLFTNFGVGILATDDNILEMKLDNGANFGWTGGFGIDITNELFGQFRFIGGKNPGDDGLATFQIGYRF
ncbi:MAG: hypothetical protein ABFD54_01125 [Armatimonadota bacterium]|nr:hypothetical protein [bacterium]